MTRKEAIKILSREKECVQQALQKCADGSGYVSPDGMIRAADYVEACSVALAALRAQQRMEWVGVKDRLPEVRQRVLCVGSNGTIYVATNWLDWPDGTISFEVPELDRWVWCTCWMPLPEAPKEEAT